MPRMTKADQHIIDLISLFQVFLDNLGIGVTISFIVGVSILIVVLKIIFIDPPFM